MKTPTTLARRKKQPAVAIPHTHEELTTSKRATQSGLATVQRVVHRHGGTTRATAAVGKGAMFRFCLPDPAEPVPEAS